MVRTLVLVSLLLPAAAPARQINPEKDRPAGPAPISVCELRAKDGFAKYFGEEVMVSGDIDANMELTLFSSEGCDQSVLLKEAEPLGGDSEVLAAIRVGIEAKRNCNDERPLHAVVLGRLDMLSNEYGSFYQFTVTNVLSAEFNLGVSKVCQLRREPQKGPTIYPFPERLEFEGRVMAYDWPGHTFPGFENIHIEHLLVHVDEISSGKLAPYIRVDFWGVTHLDEYKLPKAVFEAGNKFRFSVVPPSMAAADDETCGGLSQETIRFVDENDKNLEEISALTILEPTRQLPALRTLPCYVVQKNGIVVEQ